MNKCLHCKHYVITDSRPNWNGEEPTYIYGCNQEECVLTPWHRFDPDDEATFPKPGKYILLSFSNWMIPAVGEYRQTEDGGGNFFLADSDDPLVKIGIFVNAWMPLPECYKEDTNGRSIHSMGHRRPGEETVRILFPTVYGPEGKAIVWSGREDRGDYAVLHLCSC